MNPERVLLFRAHTKTATVAEQVEITVTRHINNYYMNHQESLDTIHASLRPEFIVKSMSELKLYISKNEMLRNKKLAWIWKLDTPFAADFKSKVNSGLIPTLTEAKTQASRLYSEHSETYQADRATKERGGNVKKTRSGTEQEYRLGLAAKKILCPLKIVGFQEEVQQILDLEEEALDVQYAASYYEIRTLFPNEIDETTSFKQSALIAVLATKLG